MTTTGLMAIGVTRSFGEVHAVRGATLEVPPGRVTGLVGPNGAGKTTLLLMLSSLLAPDEGEIRIDGINPIEDPQQARSRLGWMPDSLGTWGSLSARETLVMTGRLYDMPKADAQARADVLLSEVGLTDLADAPARVLSRGQKQRVGLARALVHDPGVVLLDEPASGLDPMARIELRTILRRFAAEGRAVLVSSHILAELEEVVDDAVFMRDGETVDGARLAAVSRPTRPWRIRLAGADPRIEAPRIAHALGIDVTAIGIDRRDALVAFSSEDAAAAALRALIADGLPVAEFVAAQGNLERAFLDLGGHSPDPSVAPGGSASDPGFPAAEGSDQ